MPTPLEELRILHTKFVFRNRLNMPQELKLLNNDSVMVMPNAIIKVDSDKVFALPGKSFEIIEPGLDSLIAVGLVTDTTVKETVKPNVFANTTVRKNDQGE